MAEAEQPTLAARLTALIRQSGPLPLSRFMADAVGHYYARRDPFGAAGDFTTAPEISQMFGELLGLWAADTWMRLGAPDPVDLIELGPGRGTLMADMLRAIARVPRFAKACRVRLVEASPVLRQRQRDALKGAQFTWHDDFAQTGTGAFILLANEFFDALPIRQFTRHGAGWHERMVDVGAAGEFVFRLAPAPVPIEGWLRSAHHAAPAGSIVEICPAGWALAAAIAARATAAPGAALIIDYGAPTSGIGDTLQALKRHRFVPPLQEPGEVDLTAHVDFAALVAAAAAAGGRTFGPLAQGELLRRIGIGERAARLAAQAGAQQRADIAAALERLTAASAMGTLFQAICIASPGLDVVAGFDPA